MRRVAPAWMLPSLLPFLLVAACTGSGPAPLPTASVSASFPPHGLADTIVIQTADRLPLRQAELIAPDGTAIPSESIDVTDSPRITGVPGLPAELSGASPAELILPNPVAAPALRSQGETLIVVSQASIVLPDPVAYRRDWQKYRIRLRFGSAPGAVEWREIVAPAPPGPSPPAAG